MKYDKLVRDNMPNVIVEDGYGLKFHIADKKEYWQKLKEKLLEEAQEFVESEDEDIEELADIMEVLKAINEYKGYNMPQIVRIQEEKAKIRGRLKTGIILEEITGL